jgi:CCR4-NOT transcription complex subunit 4
MPAADVSKPEDASKEQAKVERQAAKKAAAAERALERQKAAQEKASARAAEKARLAQEKVAEQERLAAIREAKERAERVEREKAEQEKLEKERATQQKAAQAERTKIAKAQQEKRAEAEKEKDKEKEGARGQGKAGGSSKACTTPKKGGMEKQTPASLKAPEPVVQAPIRSKLPKKNKPVARPIRIPKDNEVVTDEMSAAPSVAASETPAAPTGKNSEVVSPSPSVSRAQSVDRTSPIERTSLADTLDELDDRYPSMDLPTHPFFDMQKINPAAKMPLEYGPLVHALSALSVGGGSFATNMPSGSIDNAVSSFQQLLETLTQTISDLLRLLPRTTWDDSSSFDGVLRDMLKGDDFLDDTGDDAAGKEDEVAALTLALERRARWMEVQLSKLEELHRDINTAAVRAVLAFNDSGWDRHAFMPRIGNTLKRFDSIGMAEQDGKLRPMSADELEKKLVVAKEAAVFAETELREAMEKMQGVRPVEVDDF